MKILHVITDLDTGGAEMMLVRLLSQLDRDRFQSSVISLMDRGSLGDRLAALQIPLHILNLKAGRLSPASIGKLRHLVCQFNPNLIQGWMYHGNLAAQLANFLASRSIPILWNIRQSLYSLKYEKFSTATLIRLEAWLSTCPTRILYNSRTSAQHHERLGYQASKTLVIPNGFDTAQFQPNSDAYHSLRRELELPADTLLIGLVARYHPMKDHATFLHAVAYFVQQRSQLNLRFLLCGSGVDWHNSSLAKLIDTLNLRPWIHLLGERQDIARLQAALNFATLSSFTESFPNALGEAMACGVPCIATAVGDTPWLVGDTGWLVPPRSPDALAAAWSAAIALSPAQRQQRGQSARERIKQHFSLPAIVVQYESLYTAVGASKP